MDEIEKTVLTSGACTLGAIVDAAAMYVLADKTAQHCEKLGDAALAVPYWVSTGVLEVGLFAVGLGLISKWIQTVRDGANYSML